MFKKLKDKLAEEVKSSPHRIQQFAQAAQAAVTSASSSISDITNSDLFSIGDNEAQQGHTVQSSPSDHKSSTFQDISLIQSGSLQTSVDSAGYVSAQDISETQRQRRLSNSSFASDVSFRLPSYESPSVYHLQSDVEVSASEAEERGFSSGNVSLDRVTKEQIYAAYRRTQDRYTKYRTQYADLARHYKLLERENAKAKSVLVETQDKALRRISELREQCSLEQSAKAHLEKALRVDLEEKTLKIETLNTKIKLLQNNGSEQCLSTDSNLNDNTNNIHLISFDNEHNLINEEVPSSETLHLNNKIEKLEKLLTKYKESLKTTKEKNAQLITEIQILSGEVETKHKEINELKSNALHLDDANQKIRELCDLNEQLQNKINVHDFNENKKLSEIELDYKKAQEEIKQLKSKINVFSKREEEYAISLAENKLSIHKELESKEREIKSLKDRLTESRQEIQSLDIVLHDYKNNTTKLEEECSKLKTDVKELATVKNKISELESQLQILSQKCQSLENSNTKANEEYKCIQLQLKQETAEKLAMIDRNSYLENRNTQLTEENSKKKSQINNLEKELQLYINRTDFVNTECIADKENNNELEKWKGKCEALEFEIQEEREELGKLQSEIETLLANDDLLQIQNSQLKMQIEELKSENVLLKQNKSDTEQLINAFKKVNTKINFLKQTISSTTEETMMFKEVNNGYVTKIKEYLSVLDQQTYELCQTHKTEIENISHKNLELESRLKENELVRIELDNKLSKSTINYDHCLDDLASLKNEKQILEEQLREFQTKYQEIQNTKDHDKNILKQRIDDMVKEINSCKSNNETLKKDFHRVTQLLEESNAQCEHLNNEKAILNKEITDSIQRESLLKSTIEALKGEKETLANEIKKTNTNSEMLQNMINRHENDQSILKQSVSDLKHTIELMTTEKLKLVEELDGLNAKSEILQDVINRNNNEQTNLKLAKLEHENHSQVEEIQNLNRVIDSNMTAFKRDNDELVDKLKISSKTIENMQQNINILTQENLSLKTQSDEITNNIKELETELSEVRKSHTVIEIEKDHLSSIIEQLETKVKDTQTNSARENDNAVQTLKERKVSKPSFSDTTDGHQSLGQEGNLLKEENRRLQSDVAGLQTYLAKISKENSSLNDKLRELMACSESTLDKSKLTGLQNEERQEKDKLDDLIRENRVLEEENLELKDQLNSQHYAKFDSSYSNDSAKETEYLTLKEKYTSLIDINSKLENRIMDLEQMDKAVNGSMSLMQQQNEKLRLCNEKLERRLDEALVSLRHLHALQENTELEYLRNILYEYLTGTGAHSITLAKVLAAVVKFDKTQTDQVLQKEKERQGFLKQLGLL